VSTPDPICLYALVPADDAKALGGAARGLRLVRCGPVLAITGRTGREPELQAALRHDRIVGRALETCSSVVPFRLGVEFRCQAELEHLLQANLPSLTGHLARLAGRVEMGFKARLAGAAIPGPMRLPFDLERVRALAPDPKDRREQLARAPTGDVFEGCYLILRQAIAAFWSAVEDLRRRVTGLPVLGSGPWAAYSFCDFALRTAPITGAAQPPRLDDSMR
jgi:gas vesicle protein GvpL/GvpF